MPTAEAIFKIARMMEQTGGRDYRPVIRAETPTQPRKRKGKKRGSGYLRYIEIKGDLKLVVD